MGVILLLVLIILIIYYVLVGSDICYSRDLVYVIMEDYDWLVLFLWICGYVYNN